MRQECVLAFGLAPRAPIREARDADPARQPRGDRVRVSDNDCLEGGPKTLRSGQIHVPAAPLGPGAYGGERALPAAVVSAAANIAAAARRRWPGLIRRRRHGHELSQSTATAWR